MWGGFLKHKSLSHEQNFPPKLKVVSVHRCGSMLSGKCATKIKISIQLTSDIHSKKAGLPQTRCQEKKSVLKREKDDAQS